MATILYHHPHTRASNVVWMLEEVGVPYELRFVDISTDAQKAPEMLALNPMGKLPVLSDGGQIVTESAAIGLYLADRYALGRLAPKTDDPMRGTYLRWSLFAPSVIEPGTMSKLAKWEFKPSQAGWGSYEAMLVAMESALVGRSFILGEQFSMADVIFGGTLRYMLAFKLIEASPLLTAYSERLAQRPALQRGEAVNTKARKEHRLEGSN